MKALHRVFPMDRVSYFVLLLCLQFSKTSNCNCRDLVCAAKLVQKLIKNFVCCLHVDVSVADQLGIVLEEFYACV